MEVNVLCLGVKPFVFALIIINLILVLSQVFWVMSYFMYFFGIGVMLANCVL